MSRGESAMMVQRGDNEAGNHSQTCAGCMRVGQCIFGGHRLQLSSPDLAIHVVIAHSFGSLSRVSSLAALKQPPTPVIATRVHTLLPTTSPLHQGPYYLRIFDLKHPARRPSQAPVGTSESVSVGFRGCVEARRLPGRSLESNSPADSTRVGRVGDCH